MPAPTSRRDFLIASAVAALAGSAGSQPAVSQDRKPLPKPDEIRRLSEEHWKLVDLINAYRREREFKAVPLSPRLTAVASLHARDLHDSRPQEKTGSLHSWSESDRWKGGAYRSDDESTWPVMWEKPRELYGYKGHGFEIVAAGVRDMPHALEIWKKSPPHHDVIINRGVWAGDRWNWQALGAVFHDGFACAWFGAVVDE